MKRDNSIKGKERVGRRIISTHTNKSRKIVPNWTVSCEILRGVCVSCFTLKQVDNHLKFLLNAPDQLEQYKQFNWRCLRQDL
jgi:hypothetical protein